jgi:D-amino-acid dehydrogenase
MSKSTIVLGAGMVGISTALSLQARGQQVTLVDRKAPAMETSYGNAGVIAVSSMLPFNNPSLLPMLPKLLGNRSNGFRYNFGYALKNAPTLMKFLWLARQESTLPRAQALFDLLTYSSGLHEELLAQSGELDRLRKTGWLKLYRTQEAYSAAQYERNYLEQQGIESEFFDKNTLSDIEPNMKPVFEHGTLIKDNRSVDNPTAVAEAYVKLFIAQGGRLEQHDIKSIDQGGDLRWQLSSETGERRRCTHLVLATGPWSRDVMKKMGMRLPLFFERGGHRQFKAIDGRSISRPIYDSAGGYVMTPMEAGTRITCGVSLDEQHAPYSSEQLDQSETLAKTAFYLGPKLDEPDWQGNRPTFADSLPMIGETQRKGLWINTGHQHIGFSTGPGSGELLAQLLMGETTKINAEPYSPKRFGV